MEAQSLAAGKAAAATSSLPGMGAIPHAAGVAFRVWAPHADQVAVSGSFNDWSKDADPMTGEGNGYWYVDLAHAGIAALRALGLPARYVSGYLMTKPPPGRTHLLGSDASHAWFSVFAPPFGWVDLDPTNAVIVGEGHVTAAWGRDYGDVAPVTGIILGGHDHVVDVGVDVIPVTE